MTELPMHRIHERDEDLSDELPEGFTEAMAADLELVISALNGHLSPERVAEVTRRLEEDPAFRELAAPMLLTWSVPSYLERHPRPVGELENAWNEFAQKAGIAPATPVAAHRRPSIWRRLRIIILFLFLLPLTPFVTLALIKVVPNSWWSRIDQPQGMMTEDDLRERDGRMVPLPPDTGWVAAGVGVQVRAEPGATLSFNDRLPDRIQKVRLETGAARFRVAPITRADPTIRRANVLVQTPNGSINAEESEFVVTVHGDTTDVDLVSTGRSANMPPGWTPLMAAVRIVTGPAMDGMTQTYMLRVEKGVRTSLVRNEVPARYRTTP